MRSVVILRTFIISIVMQSIATQNVIRLSVATLNVVAPMKFSKAILSIMTKCAVKLSITILSGSVLRMLTSSIIVHNKMILHSAQHIIKSL
jgi:hypothetical protein